MRATIQDVAREAGVSVATVSRAMRGMTHVADETRRRVLETAARLGYAPHFGASALAGGTTGMIGLVAPYFHIWYTSQILTGVEQVLSEANRDLVIFAGNTPENRARFVDRVPSLETRIDGLILVDFFPNEQELEVLRSSALALVAVGEELPGLATIAIDNFEAAHRATSHLIDMGHTRIAVAGGRQLSLDASPVLAARIDGHRAALEDAGIKLREDYNLGGMLSPTGGRAAVDELIDLVEPPTAVFFLSDEMAMGGLAQARRRGLHVPSELSVIGFDDHDQAEAAGLTTIRQQVRQLGVVAAQRMLAFSDVDRDGSHELMPVELVVRHTTASPH